MDAIAAELIHTIPRRVARAWGLLCGENRLFEWCAEGFVPQIGAHSYLLSMDFLGLDDKAGIAISLCPQDASDMACAMFKLPIADLSVHDIEDACMEVCNVLADALSDIIAPKDRLHTGLPQPLETNGYQQLCMDSALRCTLRSVAGGQATYLLVFNPLNPSFETRPAPL
jgi:hypothetical protein